MTSRSGDAIIIEGVGKRFRRRTDRPTTLKERLVRFGRVPPEEWFWGLKGVDLRVARGSMIGLLGHNGAGKSTLLRLIGGVGRADTGSIRTFGRIGAILELGAGFHPDMTGRENGVLAGIIAGLTRQQVLARFEQIVAFAELEDFIDAPVRTYSSGMVLRLAFAVAAHADADILLIDEVLAVGDIAFQRKCVQRIHELRTSGATIALVTHDTDQVGKYCDQALWLSHGQVVASGAPHTVVDAYCTEMSRITQRRTPIDRPAVELPSGRRLVLGETRFGSLEVEIQRVSLQGPDGQLATELNHDSSLRIEIELFAKDSVPSPIVNVSIVHEDGRICVDTDTGAAGVDLKAVVGKRKLQLVLDRLGLGAGSYVVNVGVYERTWAFAYDEHTDVYPFSVRSNSEAKGLVAPPQRWKLEPAELQPAPPAPAISLIR